MLLSLGFLLMAMCAVTSGFSNNRFCTQYRAVSRKVVNCQPNLPEDWYGSGGMFQPNVLRSLSIYPCQTQALTNHCLRQTLNSCIGNVNQITGYLETVSQSLCDGTNLVDWFDDVVQSLVPVPQTCVQQLLMTGMEMCQEQGLPPIPNGWEETLSEGVNMSRAFFTEAINCTLNNMQAIYAAAPSCSGVNMRQAIFMTAFFINGLPGDLFTMHFSAEDILQIRARLLPFDQ